MQNANVAASGWARYWWEWEWEWLREWAWWGMRGKSVYPGKWKVSEKDGDRGPDLPLRWADEALSE